MAEISKDIMEELKKKVGFDTQGEYPIKNVKIIKDKKQFSIRIPKKFSEIMAMDEKKDYFEFHLIPDAEKEEKFILEGRLIKSK